MLLVKIYVESVSLSKLATDKSIGSIVAKS